MPYDLYWYGDPWAVWAYHEAHEMRRDEVNQQLWMNGIYVFNAIGTAVANIHLDGKHHKPVPYMDKPLPIRPMTAEEKEARAAKDTEDVIAYLNAWAEAFNKEHGNG